MLTKDDLQAIKDIMQANNKMLTTILRIELAETNKRIDSLSQDTKELKKDIGGLKRDTSNLKSDVGDLKKDVTELKKGQKVLENKIDKLNYEERIQYLEQGVKTLTSS